VVVLVGYLHVAKRVDPIWHALHRAKDFVIFLILIYSFGDGALKAITAGHFKGVLHPFELVFVLRDTFGTAWNKERRRSIKLFWTTLFMMGPLKKK
jgi:hypothetical protein